MKRSKLFIFYSFHFWVLGFSGENFMECGSVEGGGWGVEWESDETFLGGKMKLSFKRESGSRSGMR